MRTIIAGSRVGPRKEDLDLAMTLCGWTPTIIISGGARGADTLGEYWATQHGVPIERFPADWEKHGKSAGFIRNREMAHHAEALIALWDGRSRGTRNMIDVANFRNLKVYVHII